MTKTYVAALALIAGGLSGCEKSDDPRALVMSLITGVPPGAENFTAVTPGGTIDFSVKTTTGDDYTVELAKKVPTQPGEQDKSVPFSKFTIGKVVDPCRYTMGFSVNGSAGSTVELDFKQFGGVEYAKTNSYPMLHFGECGMKGKNGCIKDIQPVGLVAPNDPQRELRDSQAKKMREEICKPS